MKHESTWTSEREIYQNGCLRCSDKKILKVYIYQSLGVHIKSFLGYELGNVTKNSKRPLPYLQLAKPHCLMETNLARPSSLYLYQYLFTLLCVHIRGGFLFITLVQKIFYETFWNWIRRRAANSTVSING